MAPSESERGDRDAAGGGDDDSFRPMADGLAIALQCYEDRMEEKLLSLAKEQSALLARLEGARQTLPLPSDGRSRDRDRSQTDVDVAYISKVLSQAPWYTHRVRALTAQKASLAARVLTLQKNSAGLRESLPVPLQLQMADRMADWRSGLAPFQETLDMAYMVSYQGGIAIRTAPSVEAPCVGEVLKGSEAFWASERLGRLGDDTIYVKLKDGRGWVFESLNGTMVLKRLAPSSMGPPPPIARAGSGGETEEKSESDAQEDLHG